MARVLIASLILSLSLAAGAYAQQPASRPNPYLSGPVILPSLGGPPAPGTAQEAADRAAILRLQANRTPARIAQAQADQKLNPWVVYGPILGPSSIETSTPRLKRLFERTNQDTRISVNVPKGQHDRARPPLVDLKVTVCVDLPEGGRHSYPSGHAMWGRVSSLILSQMAPAKAKALRARGDDFGLSRAYCGVHYPSDVAAGQSLGDAVFTSLMANPAFKADFTAAQAEVRAVLSAPPPR